MILYALCDQEFLDKKALLVEEFVELAKSQNAEILQYRNKKDDTEFIKQQLVKIRKIFDGVLIVNDLFELAEYCDGVHLGQDDLKMIDKDIFKAVEIVRATIGEDKILGISTHNDFEVIQANDMDLNYIGLGAYRDTNTKKDVNNILGNKLDGIASKSKHPVGAIGGILLDDRFSHVTYLVIGSGLLK
ncbi:thiamine phosphate synthase [Sulfurimonas sp.]|uniref:thiamine phosphate synthase n=1 Tax=Sulfurimonas sp. TaxID=2022749 RepID=UPI0025F77F03|nr:thiamine phosphate synthase [Sulfurimonas sp.]MDD5157132.1 thiamine phosphate synthase [Sulfurimonas sp.]